MYTPQTSRTFLNLLDGFTIWLAVIFFNLPSTHSPQILHIQTEDTSSAMAPSPYHSTSHLPSCQPLNGTVMAQNGLSWRPSHLEFPHSWPDHNFLQPFTFHTYSLLFLSPALAWDYGWEGIGAPKGQGAPNYSPWAKYSFVNKDGLEQSHIHLSPCSLLWFCVTMVKQSSCNRDHNGLQILKYLQSSTERVVRPT